MYAQLLIDLFKFLTPFLRNAELTKATQMLYKVWYSSDSELFVHMTPKKRLLYLRKYTYVEAFDDSLKIPYVVFHTLSSNLKFNILIAVI